MTKNNGNKRFIIKNNLILNGLKRKTKAIKIDKYLNPNNHFIITIGVYQPKVFI